MKQGFRRFLSIVPKPVQRWAWIAIGCALLIGFAAGYKTADPGAVLQTVLVDGGAATVFGFFVAIWLLCLGFVYGDAQRRAMRAGLWVCVAALFPHLLGFLLYFVMRPPIPSTCVNCGQSQSLHQRFCSWCGAPQVSAP